MKFLTLLKKVAPYVEDAVEVNTFLRNMKPSVKVIDAQIAEMIDPL